MTYAGVLNMVRFSIIVLFALAPVASAVDDPTATTDRGLTAQRIRLRLAAGDLAVDVLVAHARQLELSAEFDALAETLALADRAACKRSLAEAARLTQRAAGVRSPSDRSTRGWRTRWSRAGSGGSADPEPGSSSN
jgi:hypothetical protein